jgi:hypothetical protein
MQSIFIWRAPFQNTSKNKIKYYSGSNWFLMEYTNSSSFKIIDQEYFNDVIVYNSKRMPTDWIGNDLLEYNEVPYQILKKDDYGTLEHIGDWLRFFPNTDIIFEKKHLIDEYNTILKWNTLGYKEKHNHTNKHTHKHIHTHKYNNTSQQKKEGCDIVLHHNNKINFDTFLIKLNGTELNTSQHKRNKPLFDTIKVSNINTKMNTKINNISFPLCTIVVK